MTEHSDEQLSALVDDELEPNQHNLLIRRLERDQTLQGRWSRYFLMGEAIRRDLSGDLTVDLAQRVHASIENEPSLTPEVRGQTVSKAWPRSAAGLAVAASVAAIALAAFKLTGEPGVAQLPVAQLDSFPGQNNSAVVFERAAVQNPVETAQLADPALSTMDQSSRNPDPIGRGLGSEGSIYNVLSTARWVSQDSSR
jgi:sigma-E factor negative regulatory protein RseA